MFCEEGSTERQQEITGKGTTLCLSESVVFGGGSCVGGSADIADGCGCPNLYFFYFRPGVSCSYRGIGFASALPKHLMRATIECYVCDGYLPIKEAYTIHYHWDLKQASQKQRSTCT